LNSNPEAEKWGKGRRMREGWGVERGGILKMALASDLPNPKSKISGSGLWLLLPSESKIQ
jgi:hypothetical protein